MDGAADLPVPELDGLTPLQAARTPNLDRLAQIGRVGTCATTPEGFEPGSDVCCMSILGYDPGRYHTGRAPLEAAGLGIDLPPETWALRLNLVSVGEDDEPDAGLMLDHSGGGLADAEGRVLCEALSSHWRQNEPDLAASLALTHSSGFRAVLCDASKRDYAHVKLAPPHAILRQPWAKFAPEGSKAADALWRLMELSAEVLPDHPVNRERRAAGRRPANLAWMWGAGRAPQLPRFATPEPDDGEPLIRAAIISAVPIVTGLAQVAGIEVLHVPGLTPDHANDYAAQGRAAAEALNQFGLVICHVESPDEASHVGDWKTKIAAIEAIDQCIVAPLVSRLRDFGDAEEGHEGWRILILPDHFTLASTGAHDAAPVPFLMAGSWVRSLVHRPFDEASASSSDLHIERGHDLMEYFLRSGLAGVR